MARHDHATTSHLCSIWDHSGGGGLGESCLSSIIASLNDKSACSHMCSIDIFVDLQRAGLNLKGALFDPRFGGYEDVRSGTGQFISSLLFSYGLTFAVFFSYLAGPQSVSACLSTRPTRIRLLLLL